MKLKQPSVVTDRSDLGRSASDAVSVKLGGTALWGCSIEEIGREIGEIGDLISQCASEFLCTSPTVLRKVTRERAGERTIGNRLYSAIAGSLLRLGVMDSFVCSSHNDKPFRVIFHRSREGRLWECLRTAETLLRAHGALDVASLENRIFVRREYNTWSSASFLLGRLNYLGLARLSANGRCHLVTEIVK